MCYDKTIFVENIDARPIFGNSAFKNEGNYKSIPPLWVFLTLPDGKKGCDIESFLFYHH